MTLANDMPAQPTVVDLLEHWIGLDASTVGVAAIDRAVRERMKATGITEPMAYATRAWADASERDLLVEEVIVAESWFFRDPQVFEFVTDFAVTRAALPDRSPVRLLSAPAAAGEEPYSLVMSLFDAGLAANQFEVDAVDISRRTLARAEGGRYSVNAFRNADLGFRDRWFHQDGGQSVIAPQIRRQVRFASGNLIDAAFAAGRGPYDVIFCRNLLIYLTPAARRQVEQQLDRLLTADGLLVLGAAEPPIMKGDWIPAGTASLFALRRGIHARPVTTKTSVRGPAPAPQPTPIRHAPAEVRPEKPIEGATNGQASLESVLAEADRLANAGQLADALAWCERNRPLLAPSPQLFFLMGMLHQSAGDFDRAEGCFHKTLYLDANHEEALLALALLARRRGDHAMSEKYRQSAARAMGRKEEQR